MNKFFTISFFFLLCTSSAFAQDNGAGWHSGSIAAGCTDYRQDCSGRYNYDATNYDYSQGYDRYNRGDQSYSNDRRSGDHSSYNRERGYRPPRVRVAAYAYAGNYTNTGYSGYGSQQQPYVDNNHPIASIFGALLNGALSGSNNRYANALGNQGFGTTLAVGTAQAYDNRRLQAQTQQQAVQTAEQSCVNSGGRVIGYQGGVQCQIVNQVAQQSVQYAQVCKSIDFGDGNGFRSATAEQENEFFANCKNANGVAQRGKQSGGCRCTRGN